jgi:UDP-glucose 4-epimerase
MFKSNTSKLYKNKYILVTGAAGHIGSNLSKILIKKNFKVILIDNFSNSEKKTIQFLIKPYNKKAKQILK